LKRAHFIHSLTGLDSLGRAHVVLGMGSREHPNVHMLPLKHGKNTGVPLAEHRDPEAFLFFIIGVFYSR
jgi:hypothetical protein